MYKKKVGCLWQEKVGCLINESAFVALNYVTWPIRNIEQNWRTFRSLIERFRIIPCFRRSLFFFFYIRSFTFVVTKQLTLKSFFLTLFSILFFIIAGKELTILFIQPIITKSCLRWWRWCFQWRRN